MQCIGSTLVCRVTVQNGLLINSSFIYIEIIRDSKCPDMTSGDKHDSSCHVKGRGAVIIKFKSFSIVTFKERKINK